MTTGGTILRFIVVFLVGLVGAIGWHSYTREPPPLPAPQFSDTQPPDDPVAAAEWVGKERKLLCDSILRVLHSIPDLPVEDKEQRIRALGKLGSREAIDYLVANHQFTVPSGETGLVRRPCLDALCEIGIAAVPQMVEAYITLPAEKDPESFLVHGFGKSEEMASVAYVYAQGFLFANHENARYREAVTRLVNELRTTVSRDLPYPPPWFGEQPELKKP